MYLYKRTYIGNYYQEPEEQVKLQLPEKIEGGLGEYTIKKIKEIKPERISQIEERVGYWRKANAIHNWFVKNVQKGEDDCGDYYVEEEKLQELLDTCKKVLAASELVEGKIKNGSKYENGIEIPNMVEGKFIKDPKVAAELLPTQEGFFFGGTDYDEYYFQDLNDTIKILKDVLAEGGEVYYHSSW